MPRLDFQGRPNRLVFSSCFFEDFCEVDSQISTPSYELLPRRRSTIW